MAAPADAWHDPGSSHLTPTSAQRSKIERQEPAAGGQQLHPVGKDDADSRGLGPTPRDHHHRRLRPPCIRRCMNSRCY